MRGSEFGVVIWITGLSESGKTSVGRRLVDYLSEFKPTVFLDGDELRSALGVTDNYSRQQRILLATTYFKLAKLLADQGLIVVIATLAMFREIYEWNRSNQKNYMEIFLDVPLKVLFERDTKGLYSRYQQGLEKNIAGLDLQIDIPDDPDLIFSNNQNLEAEEIALRISKTVIAKYKLKC